MLKKLSFTHFLIVAIIGICLALFVALSALPGQIIFGYDQARDAFESYTIWHDKHLKILGPTTDIAGVSHGVLWYYVLAIPSLLSNSNPIFAAYFFLATLFIITVPLAYYFSNLLFKNKYIALITAVLYALSPFFQVSTRWLSNPIMALYITPLLLILLWKYIEKEKLWILCTIGFLFGLLIQSDLAYALFLPPLLLYIYFFKLKLNLTKIISFGGGLLLGVAPYIIADIKFGGRTSKSMLVFLSSSNSESIPSNIVINLFNRIIDLLYLSVFPINKLLIMFIVGIIFYWILKHRQTMSNKPVLFLYIWLSCLFFFSMMNNTNFLQSSFLLFPLLLPTVALGSYYVVTILKQERYILIGFSIFILAGSLLTYRWVSSFYTPLSVQYAINYLDQTKVVDYTYQMANNEPFVILSITNPLYINTTWAYVYQFYGEKKYGFLPYWGGKGQTGYLGNLPEKPFGSPIRFLIFEPTQGIPDIYVDKITYEENKLSNIVDTKKIGPYVVEKRVFAPNKPLSTIATPSSLLKAPQILNEQ